MKHKTIPKPVVCAAAVLALRQFAEKRQGIEATLKMVFHTQETLIHKQIQSSTCVFNKNISKLTFHITGINTDIYKVGKGPSKQQKRWVCTSRDSISVCRWLIIHKLMNIHD